MRVSIPPGVGENHVSSPELERAAEGNAGIEPDTVVRLRSRQARGPPRVHSPKSAAESNRSPWRRPGSSRIAGPPAVRSAGDQRIERCEAAFGERPAPSASPKWRWRMRESDPPRVACKASLRPSGSPWRWSISRPALGRARVRLPSGLGELNTPVPLPKRMPSH